MHCTQIPGNSTLVGQQAVGSKQLVVSTLLAVGS